MQAKIYILGFVQGVGMRRHVQKAAEKLNLKGYVRNLPDGRVEAVANGKKQDIEKLIIICEKGNFFSDVKSVVVDWVNEENFEDFKILS